MNAVPGEKLESRARQEAKKKMTAVENETISWSSYMHLKLDTKNWQRETKLYAFIPTKEFLLLKANELTVLSLL